jgi:serine/threonine protein kinase
MANLAMTPERWQRLQALCLAAQEQPPSARDAFLEGACAGDATLRREVESLLALSVSGFLSAPAVGNLLSQSTGSTWLGRRIGSYEIQSLLGAGGMGEVYRARDTRLQRDVAIKVLPPPFALDPERLARFEREARLLAALNHPNIAIIHGIEEDGDVRALVLELVEGETIAERLRRRGPLPTATVLSIGKQIADALAAAHHKGIIHRDLKPLNLMITPTGVVKVLDFGLAIMRQPTAASSSSMTIAESELLLAMGIALLGTPRYMSPERFEGKLADARSDIWALGCVMYEMMAGRPPFDGATVAALMAAVMSTEPPPLALLPSPQPKALTRAVTKCLAKNPDERWQTARDLSSELKWILEADVTDATKPGRSRAIAWGSVLVVVIVALATLGLYLTRPTREPEHQPTRFSIFPPETTSFRELAVSPDGRHIAFIAEAPDGSTQLWLRDLSDSQLQPVGVDNPSSPFWSPDSQFVGFFTRDKLQKVKLGSHVPEPLASIDSRDFLSRPGGSWSRDGLILYSDDAGVHEVPATGGREIDVLARSKEEAPRWPAWLPDGLHFVFTASFQGGIYLGSLRSPARQRIASARSRAIFVPPNRIVFQSGAELLAQRLDLQTWQPIGSPIRVAEGLAEDRLGHPTYGGASATLAYLAQPLSELVWVDRRGARLGSVTGPGNDWTPVLSPDERKVAFVREGQSSDTTDIFVLDLGTGITSQFTFGPPLSRQPVWSADSSRITFTSKRNGGGIFEKVASGAGNEDQLLPLPAGPVAAFDGFCDRSPNARSILERVGPFRLVIHPLTEGANEIELPGAGSFGCGQFSPDGLFVAYSGRSSIRIASVSSPAQSSVLVQGENLMLPRWRRDGQELFYVNARDAKFMAILVDAHTKRSLAPPVPLFDVPGVRFMPGPQKVAIVPSADELSYAVAKDGQRFIVRRSLRDRGAVPAIVILN